MPSLVRLLHTSGLAAATATTATSAPPPASVTVHSDTFLLLAALLCFLLCVVGLAIVARCSRLCNPAVFSVAAPLPTTTTTTAKGLKKKALQSLPTVSFAGAGGEEEEMPECAICLAEFADGEVIRVLPPCGHGFHAACVDTWLASQSTCPSCRGVLVVPVAPAGRCRECGAASVPVQASAAAQAVGEHGGCNRFLP